MSRPIIPYKKHAPENNWDKAGHFLAKHAPALMTSAVVGMAAFLPLSVAAAEVTDPQNSLDKINKNSPDMKNWFVDQFSPPAGMMDQELVVSTDPITGQKLYYWPVPENTPKINLSKAFDTIAKTVQHAALSLMPLRVASASEMQGMPQTEINAPGAGGFFPMTQKDLSTYDVSNNFPTTDFDLSSSRNNDNFPTITHGSDWNDVGDFPSVHSTIATSNVLKPADNFIPFSESESGQFLTGSYFSLGPNDELVISGKGYYGHTSSDVVVSYKNSFEFYTPASSNYRNWLDAYTPPERTAASSHGPDLATVQRRMNILLGNEDIADAYHDALQELRYVAPNKPVGLIGMANILVAVCERDPEACRAIMKNDAYERTFLNLKREISDTNPQTKVFAASRISNQRSTTTMTVKSGPSAYVQISQRLG